MHRRLRCLWTDTSSLRARVRRGGPTTPHRVYPWLMEPREHPDYPRRHVKPPSWILSEMPRSLSPCAALPSRMMKSGLYRGTRQVYPDLQSRQRGLALLPDYFREKPGRSRGRDQTAQLVPVRSLGLRTGSGPGGYWQQYKPLAAALELLEEKLGDHWLGMDVGEQDGRYIGGYASQMYPISPTVPGVPQFPAPFPTYLRRPWQPDVRTRLAQLRPLHAQRGRLLDHRRRDAQALPNSQVYYAFIRGAGKQYGVPWFGNASVWNRWGWKTYGASGTDHGPTKGTSLSLLKRLLYSHILYNSLFVGFESSYFDGADLSPVGKIQQAASNGSESMASRASCTRPWP